MNVRQVQQSDTESVLFFSELKIELIFFFLVRNLATSATMNCSISRLIKLSVVRKSVPSFSLRDVATNWKGMK